MEISQPIKVKINPSFHERNASVNLMINQSWLALQIWMDVPVTKRKSQPLSKLEKFILKAGLELNTFTIKEIKEITSIPHDQIELIVGALLHKKLLIEKSAAYSPNSELCIEALHSGETFYWITDYIHVLWLPESEEIIALDHTEKFISDLKKVVPIKTIPVPPKWKGHKRCEIIQRAIQNKRVIIFPTDVDDVHGDGFVSEFCPVFICNGELAYQDEIWTAHLFLNGRRKTRKRDNGTPFDALGEFQWIGANQLCKNWYSLVKKVGVRDLLHALNKETDISFSRLENYHNRICLQINNEEAKELRKRYILSDKMSLDLQIGDEIAVNIPLELKAVDQEASRLFNIDIIYHDILQHNQNATLTLDQLKILIQKHQLNESVSNEDLYERLWEREQYHIVYQLREREDFEHDEFSN